MNFGLLVVDMQRFFTDPSSPAYIHAANKIMPGVTALVESFRASRLPVAYSVYVTDPASPMGRRWNKTCAGNGPWARVSQGLSVAPGEPLILKAGYSVLRSAECLEWLRSREITDIVVAGVMTHLCVESTVRDAFESGFQVHVPADGCACAENRLHQASLEAMGIGFARVSTLAECAQMAQELRADGCHMAA